MEPRERELLRGMGNCYAACGANFDETLRMVSSARGLESQEVKQTLLEIGEKYEGEEEYSRLRSRLPEEFPI